LRYTQLTQRRGGGGGGDGAGASITPFLASPLGWRTRGGV